MDIEETPELTNVNIRLFYQNPHLVGFQEELARKVFAEKGIDVWGLLYSSSDNFKLFDDLEICEHFFERTNADERFQRHLQPKVELLMKDTGFGYTSMSVGDVVAIERDGKVKHYLCCDVGFEEIKVN